MIKTPYQYLKTLDRSTFRFIAFWLSFSLVIHIITAIFSIGFHHYDEHYQLLEFAGLKLGKTTPIELPWEYPSKIRPTLQPYIAYFIIKFFGIHEPFNAVLVLRQISAFLGWLSMSLFSLCVIQWIKSPRLQKALILITVLLWFLPYIHVRFSSESWSASFFFFGLSALFISQAEFRRPSQRREISLLIIAGLCFGLSYIFRMQSILLLPGVFLWYLVIGKMKFYKLFLMGMAVLAAIAVGVVFDYSFYGIWVNTAVRYFQVNIIEGRASTFGVDPWWYYFTETFDKGVFPINILIIAGVIIAWIRYPKNIITWATLPFFVVHCLVAHKELRFIFPITNAVPILMVLAVSEVKQAWLANISESVRKVLLVLFYLVLAYSGIIMMFIAAQPVRPEFAAYYYFNKKYYDKEITIIGYGENPYASFSTIPMNFYRPQHFHTYNTTDTVLIKYISQQAKHPVFLYFKEKGFKTPKELKKLKKDWKLEHYTLSPFFRNFDFNDWISRTPNFTIYNLRPDLFEGNNEEEVKP